MPNRKRAAAHKLASLSTLGVAALAGGGEHAEAGIVYSGPLSTTIDAHSSTTLTFPDGRQVSVFGSPGGMSAASAAQNFGINGYKVPNVAGVSFQFKINPGQGFGSASDSQASLLAHFRAGVTWNGANAAGTASFVTIALKQSGATSSGAPLNRGFGQSFAHEFALFRFPTDTGFDYGWIQLSLDAQEARGAPITVTVEGYAFDDSGNPIAAGAIPEPATTAMLGVGAMVLGAGGVRRWRAARRAT